MNFIINTIPKKPNHQPIPDKTNVKAYGKYLATIAGCGDCHTMQNKGKPVVGMESAGGMEFPAPMGGKIRSANITPHETTGIGRWTKEFFVQRFKAYTDSGYVSPEMKPGVMNSIMPWTMYAGMTEEDLGAIYEHLKTLPPVEHKVERFTP